MLILSCGRAFPASSLVRISAAALALLLSAPMLIATMSAARAYSERVNRACEHDYYQFCSAYPVASTELRRCMEASRNTLSRPCINALVAAGEVPRKYLKKRW
jgi:hypothetical protein